MTRLPGAWTRRAPDPLPGLEAYPLEVRHSIRFTASTDRTRIEMRLEPVGAPPGQLAGFRQLRDDMARGYGDSWDRMEAQAAEEGRSLR